VIQKVIVVRVSHILTYYIRYSLIFINI